MMDEIKQQESENVENAELWEDASTLQKAIEEGKEKLFLVRKMGQMIYPLIIYFIAFLILSYILQFIGADIVLPSAVIGGLCMLGAFLGTLGAFQREELSLKWDVTLPLIMLLSLCFTVVLNYALSLLPLSNHSEAYQSAAKALYAVPFWQQLILYGIISPLAEELIFRGAVYRRMRTFLPVWPCAIFSALAFGLYHGNIVQGIYGFLMGMLMAFAYEWTRSFFAPLLFHMVANVFSCLVTTNKDIGKSLFKLPYMILFAVIGILILVYFTYRRKKKKTNNCSK